MSRNLKRLGVAIFATLALAPTATQVASAAGTGPTTATPPTSDARGDFCKPWHPPCA